MGNEKAVKFVRHQFTSIATVGAPANMSRIMMWHMKLIYEFWGFCVNGGTSLRAPGGFAATSSYLSMSAAFETGSNTLIASGTDGSTTYGLPYFTAPSVNWSSGSMIGKYLVTWVSGSSSTDDSIYEIKQVLNTASIVIETNHGGTPMSGTNRPSMTTRSNINFRVIDMHSASLSGLQTNMYMVLELNGPGINAGQARSQVKLRVHAPGSDGCTAGVLSLSPSGSWNGSTFSDGSPELDPDVSSGVGGALVAEWLSPAGSTPFDGGITLIGDTACIMMYSRGDWTSDEASWFHVEVPTRLYPSNKDPNPIAMANSGLVGMVTDVMGTPNDASTLPEHFGAGWHVPNPFDNGTLRRWCAMIRSPTGDFFPDALYEGFTGQCGAYVEKERFKQMFYNRITKRSLIFDVILGHYVSTTSFSIGRVQLRRAAIMPGPPATNVKFGVNGEWIHVGGGVLWPWDNAILPYNIFENDH